MSSRVWYKNSCGQRFSCAGYSLVGGIGFIPVPPIFEVYMRQCSKAGGLDSKSDREGSIPSAYAIFRLRVNRCSVEAHNLDWSVRV